MKFLPKEYRSIAGASAFAVLSMGGSGTYFWFAFNQQTEALEAAAKKSAEHKRLMSGNPVPSQEQLKQLETQRDQFQEALKNLRTAISALNFGANEQTPQEFQKALNDKTQSFSKKAEKYTVAVPPGFYMNFDQYLQKLPSPEAVPIANRRLSGAEVLLDDFLESRPLSLREFKVRTPELEPDRVAPKPAPVKVDPKAPKVAAPPPPPKPVLEAQSYTLQFTARPDSLRDFLNSLAAETRGLFVLRRIKVVNNKEKEPPVKGVQLGVGTPEAGLGGPAVPGNPMGLGGAAGLGNPTGAGGSFARYVLGDEHVEVEMSIDLVTLAEEVSAAKDKEAAK